MRRFIFLAAFLLAPSMALAGAGIRQGIIDEIHSGTALVQSDGPNRVVILFDSEARKVDGNVDVLYSITSKNRIDEPVSLLLQDARVSVEESRVVVTSRRSREVVILDLGGGCPELQLNPAAKVYRFSGDELLRQVGLNLPPLVTMKRQGLVAYQQSVPEYQLPDDGLGNSSDCDSGGAGSSSCSQTQGSSSCSISCASGYACCTCTLFQCKCSCKH